MPASEVIKSVFLLSYANQCPSARCRSQPPRPLPRQHCCRQPTAPYTHTHTHTHIHTHTHMHTHTNFPFLPTPATQLTEGQKKNASAFSLAKREVPFLAPRWPVKLTKSTGGVGQGREKSSHFIGGKKVNELFVWLTYSSVF